MKLKGSGTPEYSTRAIRRLPSRGHYVKCETLSTGLVAVRVGHRLRPRSLIRRTGTTKDTASSSGQQKGGEGGTDSAAQEPTPAPVETVLRPPLDAEKPSLRSGATCADTSSLPLPFSWCECAQVSGRDAAVLFHKRWQARGCRPGTRMRL